MIKYLFISGSPRKGNTDYILQKVFDSVKGEKELILLRDKQIKHCCGCLACEKIKKCAIKDDMHTIYPLLIDADFIIIGCPNYFDNITGLLKDFIDRTNQFYETDKLKDKKLFTIVVGGGKLENSKRVTDQALKYFSDCHQLDYVSSYCFQGLHLKDIEEDKNSESKIQEIITEITRKSK